MVLQIFAHELSEGLKGFIVDEEGVDDMDVVAHCAEEVVKLFHALHHHVAHLLMLHVVIANLLLVCV